MYNQGREYLDEMWNYLDIIHISLGYLNLICQSYFGPYNLAC